MIDPSFLTTSSFIKPENVETEAQKHEAMKADDLAKWRSSHRKLGDQNLQKNFKTTTLCANILSVSQLEGFITRNKEWTYENIEYDY